jgi:hypothetical protein
MVYLKTKNSNLGKFWRALKWNILVYFMAIWNTYIKVVWYVYFISVVIWFIFPRLGTLYQEKSGNPGL